MFNIDESVWTLDLREGTGKLVSGAPEDDTSPDVELSLSGTDFVKLVMGELTPQQVRIQ